MAFVDSVICGDHLSVLGGFPDGFVDLTVTSPPYDNLRQYKGFSFRPELLIPELFRVTKEGGVVIWVTADATIDGSETGTSFRTALSFMEAGFRLHDTMIFKKRNPIPQIYRKRYRNDFEYMFVFSKGPVKTHNPLMEDCLHAGLKLHGTTYKNFSSSEQSRSKLANPVKEQKIRGNIWEYVVGTNKEDSVAKFHPAPFPMQLARDHILSWSNLEDIVLDPMCGSGTVCCAAKELGRHFVGIEISEVYAKKAQSRVDLVGCSIFCEPVPSHSDSVCQDEFKLNKKVHKEAESLSEGFLMGL